MVPLLALVESANQKLADNDYDEAIRRYKRVLRAGQRSV